MGRLLRRLLPLAAAFAWRNRNQITSWYQKRGRSGADKTPVGKTDGNIAPVAATQVPPTAPVETRIDPTSADRTGADHN